MSRSKVEIEYTPQDDGTVQIHKISGFPIRNPKESKESGFSIFEGNLYQKATSFDGSPGKILCKNRKYGKKYFDKVRNLLIKDICGEASAEEKKKKEIPISVPDTGILVEVKNAASGQNLYTVTAIKALTYEELPEIYIKNTGKFALPTVWQYDNELLAGEDEITLLEVGECYSYGELKKALCYIELAGRHLAQAKAHYNEETRPSWTKCDTITFKDGKVRRTTTATSPRVSSFREGLEMDLGAVDISRGR